MFSKNSIFRKTKTQAWLLITAWMFLCSFTSVKAQKPVDNTRTQRDVEVLSTVLKEYFKEANPNKKKFIAVNQRSKTFVQYFSGFGLLIVAPTYVPLSGRGATPDGRFSYSITTNDCDCEEDKTNEGSSATDEKWPTNSQIETVMKGFVSNYNTLMGLIQPNERIVFYYDKTNEWLVESWSKKHSTAEKTTPSERILLELTPEVLRLSGQEMESKLRSTVQPLDKASKPEFEIMRKIFNTTFSDVVNNAFVSAQNSFAFVYNAEQSGAASSYESFKGLGVIYNFSVNYNKALQTHYSFAPGTVITRTMSSSDVITETITGIDEEEVMEITMNEKGKADKADKPAKAAKPAKPAKAAKPATKPTIAKVDKATSDEKDKAYAKKAEEDYVQFLKEVKNYMIEYGRTLRSLEPSERLIVSISINAWNRTTLPQRIELSVLKSVLDEYNKRTLSLEDASSKIEMREYKHEGKNISQYWINSDH